jgi:hypothetical protein
VIVTRVKQVLQSVEEATPTQIATDLGVDSTMVEASLEHLRVLGRVRVQSRRGGMAEFSEVDSTVHAVGQAGAAASDSCRPSTVCATCPLVPACEAASRRETSTPGSRPERGEPRYAWIPRERRRERVG